MKNTFKYLAAALALTAAVSCTKQEINAPEQDNTPSGTYQYLLEVTQEGESKTTMKGNTILWSADDQIAVVGTDSEGAWAKARTAQSILISDNVEFVPSTKVTFALDLPEGFTPIAATYPYDADNSLENKDKNGDESKIACRFVIPSQQTGVKDNLPVDAFPMVGKIVDGKCTMHNAGALIKFDIFNTDIVSIKFEANTYASYTDYYKGCISGRNYYYVDSGIFARGTGTSEDSVTLTPAETETVFEPGSYYFTVAPQNLADGFTLTVTDRFGKQAVRKTTKPFNIERNHKYTNFGSDEGWFADIFTASAGDLGSTDGSTATLYGILRGEYKADAFGFETSADGTEWNEMTGTISVVTSQATENSTIINTFSAQMTGLTPGQEYYYRARYVAESGIITYGKAKSFKTIADAGAECVKINLYNAPTQWPFTNMLYDQKEGGLLRGTSSAANYGGTVTDLTLNDGNTFVVKATTGMWLNTNNACLTVQGKKGDYIQFPIIEGKKPVSVSIVYGGVQNNAIDAVDKDNNNQGLISINKIIGDDSGIIGGGDKYDPRPVYFYDSHIWELDNTDDGQYEMYFNTTSNTNCYIAYLEVNYIDYVASGPQATIANYMDFTTRTGDSGGGSLWPFAQTQGNSTNSTSPVGPFYKVDYPDLQYMFHISDISGAVDYWRTTADGLHFGSAAGDYMEIMPVVGYKLTKIELVGGKTSSSFYVADENGNALTETKAAARDQKIEFILQSTTKNTGYRLALGESKYAAIREMWITYELVE